MIRVPRSIRTRTAARLTGAAIAIACCIGTAAPARAEPLEFVFTTTLDATDFGLSSLEPFTVRFRYDPLTVPLVISLGAPAVRSIYGPIRAWLEAGGDVVQIEAQLAIDDENNGHDSFSLDAASYLVGTSLSGSIQGVGIRSMSLYFLEQSPPLTMFASLDPPGTVSFAVASTLIRLDVRGFGSEVATRDFAPAQFGAFGFMVPEPAQGLQAIALAPLAWLARRRRRPRETGPGRIGTIL